MAYSRAMPKGRPASRTRTAIGERIAQARLAAGLTQEQLAEAMGVTQRVVTYWERKARVLRGHQLVELAGVLKTTVEELLGRRRRTDRLSLTLEKLRQLPTREQQRLLQGLGKLIDQAARKSGK